MWWERAATLNINPSSYSNGISMFDVFDDYNSYISIYQPYISDVSAKKKKQKVTRVTDLIASSMTCDERQLTPLRFPGVARKRAQFRGAPLGMRVAESARSFPGGFHSCGGSPLTMVNNG